jgi:hypothetical protein
MKWYDYTAMILGVIIVAYIWLREPETVVRYVDVTCNTICVITLPDGIIYVHQQMLDAKLMKLRTEYWEDHQLYLRFNIK